MHCLELSEQRGQLNRRALRAFFEGEMDRVGATGVPRTYHFSGKLTVCPYRESTALGGLVRTMPRKRG